MDTKPDTTNCVYRMLIPDLDNEYWDIKVANCGIVYPVTLPIALHPNPFGKLKIVVVLWPDVMYCDELFLDICHKDYYILNQTVHIV